MLDKGDILVKSIYYGLQRIVNIHLYNKSYSCNTKPVVVHSYGSLTQLGLPDERRRNLTTSTFALYWDPVLLQPVHEKNNFSIYYIHRKHL